MEPTHSDPKIPIIRINQNSAIIYEMSLYPGHRSAKQKENESNLTRGNFNGYLSKKAKQKVKKILRTWLAGARAIRECKTRARLPKIPYFTFVTLTLSSKQKHSDQYIRRYMLNQFIQICERKHNVWHHLYVCEKQKNGNIHFHLLIDSFIDWKILRDHWNKIQDLHGYITPFRKLYSHSNPNSTDIHALRGVKDVVSYIIKYMTKEQDTLKVKGRIWGCSDALRKLIPYEKVIEGDLMKVARELCNDAYFEVERKENYTLIVGPVMRYIEKYHKQIHDDIITNLREQVTELYKIHPEILRKRQEEEEELKRQQMQEHEIQKQNADPWNLKNKRTQEQIKFEFGPF
jgi:hypothetical protein